MPDSVGVRAMTDGGYDATNRKTSRLRVFISYSRDDLYFADQLAAALGLHNFEVAIDRHRISGGEEQDGRLQAVVLAQFTADCQTVELR